MKVATWTLLVVLAGAATAERVDAQTTVLLRSGDPLPGTPVANGFDAPAVAPAVANDGRVQVRGGHSGPSVSGTGVWRWVGPSSVESIMASGGALPGLPGGVTVTAALQAGFGRTGGNALVVQLAGTGVVTSNDTALYGPDTSGGMRLVAREGSQAGGFPAGSLCTSFAFTPVWVTSAGQTLFRGSGTLAGGVTSLTDSAVWSVSNAGAPTVLLREGTSASWLPAGALLSHIGNAIFNDLGEVASGGTLVVGTGGVTSSDDSVLVGPGPVGTPVIRVREGGAATGIPGALFSFVNSLESQGGMDDGGNIIFHALLRTGAGGVTFANDQCLWRSARGGGLLLLVREGSPAPGFPAGYTFASFDRVAIAGDAFVSFTCSVNGPGGAFAYAIYGPDGDGVPTLLAKTGDQAPGYLAGAKLDFLNLPAMDATGRVVFTAWLEQGSGRVDVSNDRALLTYGAVDGLELLLRGGDRIGVAPGDERTVGSYLWPNSAASGSWYARPINDSGRIVLGLETTDGMSVVATGDSGARLGLAAYTCPSPRAWLQAAGVGPVANATAAFAFDSGRAVAVSHAFESFPNQYQTWEWNGTTWAQRAVTTPAVSGAEMVYDSGRSRCVLKGGAVTSEFNGTAWTSVAAGGPNVVGHAMAYDAARSRTVMFGGFTSTYSGATWEYNGTVWTQAAVSGPGARRDASAAYDLQRQVVVVFGGRDGASSFGDTWEYDGVSWTLVSSTGPSARYGAAMFYDSGARRVVVVGGTGAADPGTAWEWDGESWEAIDMGTAVPVPTPPMVHDPARAVGVLHGSSDALGRGDGQVASLTFVLRDYRPRVTLEPIGATVTHGSAVSLSCAAANDELTTISYRWRKNGAPLSDDGRIGGTQTATLSFSPVVAMDAGVYDCEVLSDCDAVRTRGAVLAVRADCNSADFDGDGDSGTDLDIEAFIRCVGGLCCDLCQPPDFDNDGDAGTDADIEFFIYVLGGGTC